MPDVFSKRKRSEVMSRIRSRGNRDTELALVKLLRAHGISGWRRHVKVTVDGRWLRVEGWDAALRRPRTAQRSVPTSARGAQRTARPTFSVRPDFVWKEVRLALFVDGCFWHGCPKHATRPKQNASFWRQKLAANQARDRRVNRALRRAGWRVVRIWEHQLKRGARSAERGVVGRIRKALDTNFTN